MEALTNKEKAILALAILQAIGAGSVSVASNWKDVEFSHLDSYFANGWALPGSIFTCLISVCCAAFVFLNSPRSRPVCGILQCIHEAAFGDPRKLGSTPIDHKVTLFAVRARRGWVLGSIFRWLLKDHAELKLVPQYRFPLGARRPRRSFRVSKNDRSKCEGVAGLVFGGPPGEYICKVGLPALNAGSSPDLITRFAEETNDSEDRVRKYRHYDMRSIGGFPLLAPENSDVIGVVMFDSSSADGVESVAGNMVQWGLKALSRAVTS